MIPDRDDINAALEDLVVGPFDQLPDHDKLLVCGVEEYTPDGSPVPHPQVNDENRFPIGIGFRHKSAVKLTSLATLVQRALADSPNTGMEHATVKQRTMLSGLVLAIAQISTLKNGSIRTSLTEVLDTFSEATLRQTVVLPHKVQDEGTYQFGEFKYQRLNATSLRSECRHAGSAYPDVESLALNNNLSLSRASSVTTLNVAEKFFLYRMQHGQRLQQDLLYRLFDEFFFVLSEIYWADFFSEVDRQQSLAAASSPFHISSRGMSPLFVQSKRISVFTRSTEGHGWVCPGTTKIDFVLPLPSQLVESNERSKQCLRIDDWGSFSLDGPLKQLTDYLFTVLEHEMRGRHEEALLHCVFALDHLLGGKSGENLGTVVKERVASLAAMVLGLSYADVKRLVQSCYQFRSGYAHRGERSELLSEFQQDETASQRLKRLLKVARVVFAAGCWARRQEWCDSLETWHARIDVLRAKLNAGLPAEPEIELLGLNRLQPTEEDAHFYKVDWDL